MRHLIAAASLALCLVPVATTAQTWQGIDLRAMPLKEGTPAEAVPGADAIPVHPDWGRLAYFMPMNFKAPNGQQQKLVRPAFLKTWGEDCDAKVVQTMLVARPMWNSLNWITNQPYWGYVATELGWTREKYHECTGLPRNTLVRLVNEVTGEEVFFTEQTRIAAAEVERFMATDTPAVAFRLSPELSAATREFGFWNYALSGMFSIRPQPWARNYSSRFAYVALMHAYSERADSGDGSCRFAGDVTGTLTTTSDDVATNRRVFYCSPDHAGTVAQFFNGSGFLHMAAYKDYLADARAIVQGLPCADPMLAVLRENLHRWYFSEPALTDAERDVLAAGVRPGQAFAPQEYPVFSTDWRPFVDGCMANWRGRIGAEPSFDNLVHCTCAEYTTQVTGDRGLYDLFTQNWISGLKTSTPKSARWVQMWNDMCGGDPEKAPPIAVDHARQY